MKKIIQHGIPLEKPSVIRRFKCVNCGCIFDTDLDEYLKVEPDAIICWRGREIHTKYYSFCPECEAVAKEVIAKQIYETYEQYK